MRPRRDKHAPWAWMNTDQPYDMHHPLPLLGTALVCLRRQLAGGGGWGVLSTLSGPAVDMCTRAPGLIAACIGILCPTGQLHQEHCVQGGAVHNRRDAELGIDRRHYHCIIHGIPSNIDSGSYPCQSLYPHDCECRSPAALLCLNLEVASLLQVGKQPTSIQAASWAREDISGRTIQVAGG